MSKKKLAFRTIRKGANITRKVLSKAETFSGRVERKADRIVHGTDPTVQIHDSVLLEQVLAELLPEIVPIHPALPLVDRKAAVSLLIPSLQKSSFFGGTATALIVAGSIAMRRKMPLRIIETIVHGKANTEDLQEFLKSANIGWESNQVSLINLAGRKYNHYGYLDVNPEDIYIASAWWDAYLLDKLPLKNKYIYLIQDFEPIFYNNSDQYALSESTYHSDKYIAICNTKLMYDFMLNHGYNNVKNGSWFEPAVSRTTRNTKSARLIKSNKSRLFIYGRPGVHRNLYATALGAVDYAFANNYLKPGEWEIIMAGQDKLPDILLPSGPKIKNLGKLDMNQYVDLINTIDVALSPMMAPHPNYPTLEFAAAGAIVVTTCYDIKQDLSNYSKNIVMTDISIESIASGLKEAARLCSTGHSEAANIGSSWMSALDKPITTILKAIT
jgi:hypothetical protein